MILYHVISLRYTYIYIYIVYDIILSPRGVARVSALATSLSTCRRGTREAGSRTEARGFGGSDSGSPSREVDFPCTTHARKVANQDTYLVLRAWPPSPPSAQWYCRYCCTGVSDDFCDGAMKKKCKTPVNLYRWPAQPVSPRLRSSLRAGFWLTELI